MASIRTEIGILLPDLRGGGAERVNLLLAEEFTRRGYDVVLLLQQARGDLLAEVSGGVAIHGFEVARLRALPLPLAKYLREQRPAMLLASMWPLTGIASAATLLAQCRSRVVLCEHTHLSKSAAVRGMSDVIHRRLGRAIYGMANAVVCVSNGVRDDLLKRTGIAPGKVHVVYNPVKRREVETGETDPVLSTWWQGGASKLIAVGALKPAKDIPTLLRAVAKLREHDDVRLLVLGEGPERPALQRLVSALGLSDAVRFAGFVSDPYPYMEEADLFVLSSAWEGLGNVITEALLCGTPVVSTDCPSGPAEILENGRYGRLVPVGDPAALAEAMLATLADPPDPDFLKARGREFSVERAADQYLELLDPGGKLLAGG